jgi:hypothetical protein
MNFSLFGSIRILKPMHYTFSCHLCSYERELVDPYSNNNSPCYTRDGDIEVVQFDTFVLRRKREEREIDNKKWQVKKEKFIRIGDKKYQLREIIDNSFAHPKTVYYCPKCHKYSATFDPDGI